MFSLQKLKKTATEFYFERGFFQFLTTLSVALHSLQKTISKYAVYSPSVLGAGAGEGVVPSVEGETGNFTGGPPAAASLFLKVYIRRGVKVRSILQVKCGNFNN